VSAVAGLVGSNRPATTELLAFLRPAVEERFGAGLAGLHRLPSRYSTSFVIELVDLKLTDGRQVQLVFKNLSPEALLPQARRTRPSFVFTPEREIRVYRDLLGGLELGTAQLFASREDAGSGRYWLFLEKVDGVELYQVADLQGWKRAAQWLGELHRRLALGTTGGLPASLVRYDAEWYRLWMRRAAAFSTDPAINRLVRCHESVIDHLCDLPDTVIHGDFNASNVLAAPNGRICPVDWERTSLGPGMWDLASLVTGWDKTSVAGIVRAYDGHVAADRRSLLMCRLQLCIQWLGWSPAWTPPAEHRKDWLGDALNLVCELEL
jgi:hypothetical protein